MSDKTLTKLSAIKNVDLNPQDLVRLKKISLIDNVLDYKEANPKATLKSIAEALHVTPSRITRTRKDLNIKPFNRYDVPTKKKPPTEEQNRKRLVNYENRKLEKQKTNELKADLTNATTTQEKEAILAKQSAESSAALRLRQEGAENLNRKGGRLLINKNNNSKPLLIGSQSSDKERDDFINRQLKI